MLTKILNLLFTRLLSGLISSLLGLMINFKILNIFGSDLNGTLSTISQIVVLLNIVEGGFGLATNVALYKPTIEGDNVKVNSILSATRIIFNRLGLAVFSLSLFLALFAPIYLKTSMNIDLVRYFLILSAFQLVIQLSVFSKYEVMFYATQNEFLVERVSTIFNIIGQFSLILILSSNSYHILLIRIIPLIFFLLKYPIIRFLFSSSFPAQNFHSKNHDFVALKETSNVFTQKVAALIFSSTDIIIISFFLDTRISSVYALYNFVFLFIRMIIFSVVIAPFNAFGILNSRKKSNELYEYFRIFSHLSSMMTVVLLNVTLVLILPFIRLYTNNVTDISYISYLIPTFLAMNLFLDFFGSIVGSLLNSSGEFIRMKKVSFFGMSTNIILSLILVHILGVGGILLATLISHFIIIIGMLPLFFKKLKINDHFNYLSIIFIQILPLIFGYFFLFYSNFQIKNYYSFILLGVLTTLIFSILTLLFNMLFKYDDTKNSIKGIISIARNEGLLK